MPTINAHQHVRNLERTRYAWLASPGLKAIRRSICLDPFVDRALEVFGASRLMYGGDWPFSIPAGDYPRTWNATSRILRRLDAAEQSEILRGSAICHYRLDPGRVAAAVAERNED